MTDEYLVDDGATLSGFAGGLTGKSDRIGVQFVRYLAVGGFAFSVDFAVLVGLTELARVPYLVSAVAAFVAGLIVNYLLSVWWVFHRRRRRDPRAEFALFALIGLVGLALTELILYGGTESLGIDYRISKLVAVGVVLFWNFGARRHLLTGRRATD